MKDKFNLITITLLSALTLVTLAVILMVEYRPLQITGVELSGHQEQAAFTRQQIKVQFNHPVSAELVALSTQFSPVVEFRTVAADNGVWLVTQGNVDPETEYSLTITTDLVDEYGRKLSEDFVYQFTTKSRSVAYIRKAPQGQSGPDHVIVSENEFVSSQTIYSAQDIRLYGMSSDYLVTVEGKINSVSKLNLINLHTARQANIDIGQARVSDLTYSPVRDEFIYTVQPVDLVSGVINPTGPHQIVQYDVQASAKRTITIPITTTDIVSVEYTPDGAAILIKIVEGEYYVVSLEDPTQFASLETHIDSNGFNQSGDKILFTDIPVHGAYTGYPIFSVTTADGDAQVIAGEEKLITDPAFLYTRDAIVYAQQVEDVPGARGRFRIVYHDLTSGVEEVLVEYADYSLELPLVSYDDRYIVIEKYSISSLTNYEGLRSFGYQAKPYTAELILYDLVDDKVIDQGIEGINAIWLR